MADQSAQNEYHRFLVKYLAYNGDMMELILALASLKCFEMEQVVKSKERDCLNHETPAAEQAKSGDN